MQAPLCNNFLSQVWWLLSLEERRCVATHSPRQDPGPSLVQFCGWQGRVGAPNSTLGWQPGLTSGVLVGNLFFLRVMRWWAGAFQSWLHSILFCFSIKDLEEASRCSGVITFTLLSFCPEHCSPMEKISKYPALPPSGTGFTPGHRGWGHGLPPWAATPFILPAGASCLIHTQVKQKIKVLHPPLSLEINRKGAES